jgi:hypothetical protein
MFSPSLAATALLASFAIAMPTSPRAVAVRQLSYPFVPVTFNGAAGTGYTIVVEANATAVPTNNDLSITSISMEGRADFTCTAYGIDGSITELVANEVRTKPSRSLYNFIFICPLKIRLPYCFTNTRLSLAKRAGWPTTGSDLGSLLCSP